MESTTQNISNDLPGYIVVEGVIGVGTTTLVNRLSQRLAARTVLEVFEENPFLANFYNDRDRFAFQTEMFFLLSRYRQQENFAQEDLFARFSISDYLFAQCRIFAGLTLSQHEFALFERVYSILNANVPQPDLVIYLHAPVDVLMERISKRGRQYEQHMDRDYISRLVGIYTDVFANYTDTPLMTIDTTDVNFTNDERALDALLEQLPQVAKQGRSTFVRPQP